MTPRAIDLVSVVPRRQTPTERLHEVTMASLQRAASPPEHTLELERDRNGNYLVRLAVRGTDLREVLLEGTAAFNDLCNEYPRNGASEGTGAPDTPSEPATHARSRGKR